MHTSILKILEQLTISDLYDELHDKQTLSKDDQQIVINTFRDTAHYVIDDRIVNLSAQDKVEKSIKTMIAAGIRTLPFDPMLLEFSDISFGKDAVAFVRLQTKPMKPSRYDADIYAYVYCLMRRPEPERGYMILSMHPGVPLPIFWDDTQGFNVGVSKVDTGEIRAAEHLSMTAVAAMLVAMLMLNTRGVITERISTEKLMRAREKVGKVTTERKEYTVVRIGHIYDRHGVKHAVSARHGSHMPVHWRSAHVRNQRYGPYNEPAKHRPVLIPAVLVNYDPATDNAVPLPHKEVTM